MIEANYLAEGGGAASTNRGKKKFLLKCIAVDLAGNDYERGPGALFAE